MENLVARLHLNTMVMERSNQALLGFTYIASHELQEPLRKMIVFGGHLNSNYSKSLDEKGIDYLDRIKSLHYA